VRAIIQALLDDVLELRRGFGLGMVTALARHEGSVVAAQLSRSARRRRAAGRRDSRS
jgi:acetyl-CoA carboxylase carboxyltransferase component